MEPGSLPYVFGPHSGERRVEVWSTYQLQFGGQRNPSQAWQEGLAADLASALLRLGVRDEETLAGAYATTDTVLCDVENRLFTNPGNAIPAVRALSFERLPHPPGAPGALRGTGNYLHYYQYRVSESWQQWEPDRLLARWERVPRELPHDDTARPYWLAMMRAAETGQVEAESTELDPAAPFGVRLTIHAPARGPTYAAPISENLVDGVIASFHSGDASPRVAALLAAKIPAVSPSELARLAALNLPGPFFRHSPFAVGGAQLKLSPEDERCFAGQVRVVPDAQGRVPEISGVLFTLKPLESRGTQPSAQPSRPLRHSTPPPQVGSS
jgi:hypothetical protein